MDPTIFTPWNSGLGDRWASLQLLLRLAVSKNESVAVSDAGRGDLHREIVAELNAPVHLLWRTTDPGNTPLDGFNVWATDYFPTRSRWYWRGIHKHVALHFTGNSAAREKNPPEEDQKKISEHLMALGYTVHYLGIHNTIKEAVEILAGAAFFVGCDSGFSHIAHSVGVPIFLLQYKLPVVTCHRGKSYILCEGAGDFIDHKLKTWLNYRKFLGL